MSIANLTARGYARTVDFVLVIEGWPDIWVSNPRITMSAQASGRNVYHGLLHDGIEVEERALPGEGKIQGRGMTVRVRSTGHGDQATSSFCNYPEPVGRLETSMAPATSTLDLVGTTTLADGYYYIGTETILVSTFPTISRARHSSVAQRHSVSTVQTDEKSIWVYSSPPAIEGRRAWIYMLTDDDAVTGITASQLVFKGYIQNPPRLASDGLTWELQIEHISALLSQTVGPSSLPLKPVGVYHNAHSAFLIVMEYDGTGEATWVVGWHASPDDLATAIQSEIDSIMSSIGATADGHEAYIFFDHDQGHFAFRLRTGSLVGDFDLLLGSPLCGYLNGLFLYGTDTEVFVGELQANTDYVGTLLGVEHLTVPAWDWVETEDHIPESFSFPSSYLGYAWVSVHRDYGGALESGPGGWALVTRDPSSGFFTDSQNAPVERIYIDRDLSQASTDADGLYIDGTSDPDGQFPIIDAGTDSNGHWVEVLLETKEAGAWHRPEGYLTAETEITLVTSFTTGSVADYLASLESNGFRANDGLTPFFVATDFGSVTAPDNSAVTPALVNRLYQFRSEVTVEEVLAAEALLAGCMWITDSSWQLSLIPLPLLSAGAVPERSVTTDDIVTPGGLGSWPRVDIQRDGLVNSVTVQEGYDPIEDEWTGPTFVVKDDSSIAEHKNRGKGEVIVQPYSSNRGEAINAASASVIAVRLMSFLSRPYMAITIDVGWTCFGLRLGSVVSLTCTQVPDGQGGRGLTDKRCFVVERSWNLDPASGNAPGRLVLWAMLRDVAGYAPCAYATAYQDNGSDSWTVTCDSATNYNVMLSSLGDGKVLSHFEVNDKVRASRIGTDDAAFVTDGTVTAVDADADTITIQFDSTWASGSPGSYEWFIEFQDHDASGATENMRKYAYVADANLKLSDDSIARRFS